jgi:outer membrane protein OmpA-like peptidoglycan-associated protein
MRAPIFVVLLGVAGCATTNPKGTPTAFQPVCLPCPMPCTPETSCPQPPKPVPAAAPAFSPAPGTFDGSQQVTLSSSTPKAVIRYTTDGTEPTEASPVYTGPITVDRTTTLKAIAVAPGALRSPVVSGTFTASPPPPPPAPPPPVVVKREKLNVAEKVYFDNGKATIKPVSNSLLDAVAAAILARDDVKLVRVEGYTDNVGDASFNQSLSQARAESVRDYLIGKGVAADRIEAKGFGEAMPIASNNNRVGREQNRRVEFKVIE